MYDKGLVPEHMKNSQNSWKRLGGRKNIRD
jgi:hypothetical protein